MVKAPANSTAKERAIQAAHEQGLGKLKIARQVGVGVSTVQRVLGG